jgi:hypothetical protein
MMVKPIGGFQCVMSRNTFSDYNGMGKDAVPAGSSICRGHELLKRGHEIVKSWERNTMSWPRVTKSWPQDN